MSAYLSLAPILERTAAENAGRLDAVPMPERPARLRLLAAALLRATAHLAGAAASRLDAPAPRRLATA